MKKLLSIVLAAVLMMSLACASADEKPEPEGGRKFNTNWAVQNMVAGIYYEEEGYYVSITSFTDEGKGTDWFYACYYREEDDTLVSVSSSKQSFTFDPDEPDDPTYEEPAYEGFDEEGQETVFSIDEKGCLIWKDARENAGGDLEFVNIGRFDGDWKNESEGVDVSIYWVGEDDAFYYDVALLLGSSEDAKLYIMTGVYNPETARLECTGAEAGMTDDGDIVLAEETFEAVFSMKEDGHLLYESGSGIELVEDFESLD